MHLFREARIAAVAGRAYLLFAAKAGFGNMLINIWGDSL